MATFFPAGMVKEISLKMGRFGWYPKLTLSKVMEPPFKTRSLAPTLSYDRYQRWSRRLQCRYPYFRRRVLSLDIKQDFHIQQALPQFPVHRSQEVEWQGKLEDKLIDHHKISHSHGSYEFQGQKHIALSSYNIDKKFTI